jgi:aspartyl-tRNA(Asn)/glutamyl-tRNA(Gln) amidotransferase subunit C
VPLAAAAEWRIFMKITIDDVRYIAKLIKLRFSDDEAQKLVEEFESILTHFETIDKMDLNVDLNQLPKDQKSVVRADSNTVYKDKAKLFQNVKSMRGTYVQVPKIIE